MTHYLRTFEHLAPRDKAAPPRRRRLWLALPGVLLAVMVMAWPRDDEPLEPERPRRGAAPRIALAPSQAPAPAAVEQPPARVVEQQGPKLIERLLAEKFGTPLPKPAPRASEPTAVAAPTPIPPPPPQIVDRPQLAEKPPVAPAPPTEIAALPASPPPPPPEAAPQPAVIGSKPPQLVARLTTKPEEQAKPAPEDARPKSSARADSKDTTKQKDTKEKDAKQKNASKADRADARRKAGAKSEPETTKTESKPARDDEPVVVARTEPVVARTEPVRAEPVAPRPVEQVAEQRPVAVVDRAVATPVGTQRAVVATQAEPTPLDAERVAAVKVAAPSRSSGPSPDAVRGLLDRYAAAWRRHDVDTLRAIGQVTNDGQASALRQYFSSVGDLEVEVRVLDISSDGDRARVRFTRLDRFRDPTGRQVAKESPPIEKNVVTTPQGGLRFAPSS